MRKMLWAVVFVVGCSWGKTDEAMGPHCEDTATVITLEESTALGFSGAELLALAEGTHTSTLTWSGDGGSTVLTLTLARPTDGEVRYVDSEAVAGDTGMSPAMAVECPDRLEVDLAFTFVTEDGTFNESWSGALMGTQPTNASWSTELDPAALGGSFAVEPWAEGEDYDTAELQISGTHDASGPAGSVTLQLSGADECEDGDECTAWASQQEIGTWGAVSE